MKAYDRILYWLALFWGQLPPELVAIALLAAPGILSFLAGLPWLLNLAAGGFVSWYATALFKAHVWPEILPKHQRLLLELRAWILFLPRGPDSPRDERPEDKRRA